MAKEQQEKKKEEAVNDSEIGFQFTPELKAKLHNYLNSRPMAETEGLIQTMFETEDPNPYYSTAGVKLLTDFLVQKCPRRDAKPLVEAIRNGGLLQFKITRPEKKEGAKEEAAAPVEEKKKE